MNRKEVLAAVSPYIAIFGVDGMGRGRPGMESKAMEVLPANELPPLELVGDKETAVRVRRAAAGRAMTALKALFAAEYRRVYKKEMLHLAVTAAQDRGVEITPALAKKYGIELPGKGVRRVLDSGRGSSDSGDNADGTAVGGADRVRAGNDSEASSESTHGQDGGNDGS